MSRPVFQSIPTRPCRESTVKRLLKYLVSIRLVSVLFLLAVVPGGCNTEAQRTAAITMAEDQHCWNRFRAVGILRRYHDRESLLALRRLATDTDSDVRGYALFALMKRRDRDAVPVFIDALTDRERWTRCEWKFFGYCMRRPMICQTAHEALTSLTGDVVQFDPFGPEVEREAAIGKWKSLVLQ